MRAGKLLPPLFNGPRRFMGDGAFLRLLLVAPLLLLYQGMLPPSELAYDECTMAVVSGSLTADGRPLLWKNRDTSQRLHALEADAVDGGLAWCGIVDADDPTEYWAGINSASFAIANTLPQNGLDTLQEGMGNGELMALALKQCRSLSQFEMLLDSTNQVGRRSLSNFGVFDSSGACAIYECYNTHWIRYQPPIGQGWLVRTNYLDSGSEAQPSHGIDRRQRAESLLLQAELAHTLTPFFFLRSCATDLESPDEDHPLLGRSLQETICRRWSRSAGVLVGADPTGSPGMMLARLGFPAASPPLAMEAGHPPLAACRTLEAGGRWADLVQDRVEEWMTYTGSVCWLHPEDLPAWMPQCDAEFEQAWHQEDPLSLSSSERASWCDDWSARAWSALQQDRYPPLADLPEVLPQALLADPQGGFQVFWKQDTRAAVEGRLYNLLGQCVTRYFLGEQASGERSVRLNLPGPLSAGVYLLEWQAAGKTQVYRVLKAGP